MKFLTVVFLVIFSLSFAHESMPLAAINEVAPNAPAAHSWSYWIGIMHPMILHFPLALIFATTLAEILYLFTRKNIFSCAAEFCIVCAAIAIVPTAITGLVFAYGMDFSGKTGIFLWWHLYLGLFTAILTVITAYIRECLWNESYSRGLYYLCLTTIFITVSLTAFLGGEMVWGYPFSDFLMNN